MEPYLHAVLVLVLNEMVQNFYFEVKVPHGTQYRTIQRKNKHTNTNHNNNFKMCGYWGQQSPLGCPRWQWTHIPFPAERKTKIRKRSYLDN